MRSLVQWLDAHVGLAAWVQGIGTLLALGIAIAVPICLHRRAERVRLKEAINRARGIALTVRQHLARMKVPVEHILAQGIEGRLPTMVEYDEAISRYVWEAFQFPDGLPALYGTLHELGDAAEPTLLAVHKATHLQLLVNTYEMHLTYGDADGLAETEAATYKAMVECRELLGKAITNIDGLFVVTAPSTHRSATS